MLKITGVICVLAGCLGAGFQRIAQEQQRLEHLREILRIVKRIEDEMRYGKRTVPEICAVLSGCGGERYRSCFLEIYERLMQRQGGAMEEIWRESMQKCFCDVPLREDEKALLMQIPDCLGMQDECTQASSIVQFRELVERRLRQAEDEYDGKRKMIWSVSALAGIFLVVILI